jgi:hypothetical protein
MAMAALVTQGSFTASAQASAPEYLFTVQAVSGSTQPGSPARGENERFTLTLHGVDPVTKFADRPFRSASVMSAGALVANWDAWFIGSAPNAVLTYAGATGTPPQSIVVTLTRPRYEKVGRSMTFTAVRTYRTLDPSQKGKGWKRPATPRTFTSASLFIDDANNNVTSTLTTQLQLAMQQYVFAPNDESTWAGITAAFQVILTQAWQQGLINGSTTSDAFGVTCQASAQQIFIGYLACAVRMQLPGGTSYTTTISQMMAPSG